ETSPVRLQTWRSFAGFRGCESHGRLAGMPQNLDVVQITLGLGRLCDQTQLILGSLCWTVQTTTPTEVVRVAFAGGLSFSSTRLDVISRHSVTGPSSLGARSSPSRGPGRGRAGGASHNN